jgi:hypothetical protein
MDSLYNYITNPDTIITFVVFVFTLWATWSNLNWRIKKLEEKVEEFDAAKIEAKLAEILTDLARIKEELKKVK